jgi:hypothetical protein
MKSISNKSQKGSAGSNLLIVLVVLGLVGHAAYNYIPVGFNGENMKQEMHTAVLSGSAISGGKVNAADVTKNRIMKFAQDNGFPTDLTIDSKMSGSVISSTVRYSQDVNILPFGIYKYKYQFNHTATPAGFITK